MIDTAPRHLLARDNGNFPLLSLQESHDAPAGGHEVVLKLYHARPSTAVAVAHEVKTHLSISHPNIVCAYAVIEEVCFRRAYGSLHHSLLGHLPTLVVSLSQLGLLLMFPTVTPLYILSQQVIATTLRCHWCPNICVGNYELKETIRLHWHGSKQ
jgi:hypothetical protein